LALPAVLLAVRAFTATGARARIAGMKVLIPGGAGFIGARLVARLLERGDEVHVVDDLSAGRPEHLPPHPRFKLTVLDVRTPELARLVAAERPERVWHLAANSDISAGTADPRTDLERTFHTTVQILEAMRQAEVREVVFASTSAIYGEADGALDEDHGPLRPISLYGAAKLASEAYLSAYCHLYGMRAWVFRFPNVVGPNLTHGAVYDFVRRLSRDRTVLHVLGDGTQEKPYLHVNDLCEAMLLAVDKLGEPGAAPSAYNIAGEGATTVRQIAEMVREALGLPEARIEYGTEPRGWPGDVPRFAYDTTRIRALGWRPEMDSRAAVWAAIQAEVERCRRSF
jgi:UDP-glucose 4-epimerase